MPPKDKDSDQDTPEADARPARWRIKFVGTVEDLESGDPPSIVTDSLEYSRLDDTGLVLLEMAWKEFRNRLHKLGEDKAEAMGLGDKIRQLWGEPEPEVK